MNLIEKKTNSQIVADYILSQIQSGALKFGDKLPTERDLSDQLGVSRVSIREALSGLVMLGILEARQGAGTFVAGQSSNAIGQILYANTVLHGDGSMADIMIVKCALEAECARYAAINRTGNDLKRLHKALEAYDQLLMKTEDLSIQLSKIMPLDAAVHRAMIEASHQSYLIQVFSVVSASFEVCREVHIQKGKMPREMAIRAQWQHRQISLAIEEENSELAYHTMYAHLKSVEKNHP